MAPAHPSPAHCPVAARPPQAIGLPRPSAAAMREVGCVGAEGECALSQRLPLSPPSVLTNAALSSPETAARAILWRPGGACGCPQQSRSLRCREGPDVALGPRSPTAELQAGGQTRGFRSMDGHLGLTQTSHSPFSDEKTEVQTELVIC